MFYGCFVCLILVSDNLLLLLLPVKHTNIFLKKDLSIIFTYGVKVSQEYPRCRNSVKRILQVFLLKARFIDKYHQHHQRTYCKYTVPAPLSLLNQNLHFSKFPGDSCALYYLRIIALGYSVPSSYPPFIHSSLCSWQ